MQLPKIKNVNNMFYPVSYHIQLHSNFLIAFLHIIRASTETDGPGLSQSTGW